MWKILYQMAILDTGWPGNWMRMHTNWEKDKFQVNTCKSTRGAFREDLILGLITTMPVYVFDSVPIRMDQEFYKRHGMADLKDDNGTGKTLSAAARRSFFRRRLKHKRSGSKDGKDLMALEALSADSLPFTEGVAPLSNQGIKPGIIIRIISQC